MELKKCKDCQKELPKTTEYFNKNGNGFHPECRDCRKTKRRKFKGEKKLQTRVIGNDKECSKCHNFLPATTEFFHKSSNGILGLSARCKKCRSRKKPKIEPKNGYKFCGKCKKELPMNEQYFKKNERFSTGFFSYCVECERKYKHDYRTVNIEKIKDQGRRYYRLNKENKKQYDAVYRKLNKSRITAYLKKYYSMNKTRLDEKNALWRKNNPLRYRECSRLVVQRRLARAKLLPSTFTAEQWEKCKEHFNHSCAYCGSKSILEQDHFIPLSKGGEYTKDNIVPACEKCNPSKSNKDFEDWYIEQLFYSNARERKILKYLGYKDNIQQLTLL